MLTLLGKRHPRFCDQISRRDFVRIGSLGGAGAGISLSQLLQAQAALPQGVPKDHSVVMVYLPGGPTQHETFDPKPDAPVEIRGSFGSVPTKTGDRFCELLPKLAGMSDKFSIVRSLVGMVNRHESFHCYTGRPGGRSGDREPAGGWPSFGSMASYVLGPNADGVTPYVDASPRMGHRPYNNLGVHDPPTTRSWPGFTGRAHIPLTLEGDIKNDLVLQGIDGDRRDQRRRLLESLADLQRCLPDGGLSDFQKQAWGMLTSSRLADALDLKREDPRTIQRYGEGQPTDPSFGGAPQRPKQFLLARRLVEAGVRCVTIAFGAWDWHANREGTIEYLSKKYLPVFDHTLSVFLQDLDERGLLERTSVVVWGEFGRTPRINPKGGRDHWPGTQSILLAGGGIRGGQILGKTDSVGSVPIERPVHLQEVFATLFHTLGIDVSETKIPDLNGRPRYLVDENRRPISELI